MTPKDKKSFVMYQDFESIFEALPMEARGELITSIFSYTKTLIDPTETLQGMVRIAFICIKNTLDRDREAYLARCEQNAKNARSGKKQTQTDGSGCKRSQATASDNDSDTENDHDNDSENDTDTDNERSEAPQKCAYARKGQRQNTKWRDSANLVPSTSSFDTDDFFQAALARPFDWDDGS